MTTDNERQEPNDATTDAGLEFLHGLAEELTIERIQAAKAAKARLQMTTIGPDDNGAFRASFVHDGVELTGGPAPTAIQAIERAEQLHRLLAGGCE
jgi:hypothetical protein